MEFNYFDIITGSIVLLLGLKGIINGFFKELFGLIGIIGGIFTASHFGMQVGQLISDTLFHFSNPSAISFTGFLVTLALFWSAMVIIGALFKKLGKASGLSVVDRILGFALGSGKFFLIGAVIAYALFNIKAIQSKIEPIMQTSLLFPVMVEVGGYIMHLDPVEMGEEASEAIKESVQSVDTAISEGVEKATAAVGESADEALKQKAETIINDIQVHIDSNLSRQEP